jgi:hypothetical protein
MATEKRMRDAWQRENERKREREMRGWRGGRIRI